MKHVLMISGDRIHSHMGGVGIRNWELAHALAKQLQVTLAIPNSTDLTSDTVDVIQFELQNGDLRSIARIVDVIILSGSILHFHPYLREINKPIAIDQYVPNLLESLVWHDQDDWDNWIPQYEEYLRLQIELIRAGDFFFCASEKQRDYWLGWLHAQKRINPHVYRDDPTLRKLIDVVPFGIPTSPPVHEKRVIKGVIPGIEATDKVILWSGGIWDWLDPLTLIQAVNQLAKKHADIRLYFMGTQHPDKTVRGMSMPDRAIALSQKLDIYNKHVFFGQWTPYDQRGVYLTEADLAVIAHPNHIETHFSFRTRIADCIWAGLPIVATTGDIMADWIDKYSLGKTVAPLQVDGMAAAIEQEIYSIGKTAYASAFKELQNALQWDQVVKPLAGFCLDPKFAADKHQYLTETERLLRDKDQYIEQVIQDKDDFFDKVINERDQIIEDYKNHPAMVAYTKLMRLIGRSNG